MKEIKVSTADGKVEEGYVRLNKEQFALLNSEEATKLVITKKKEKNRVVRKEFYPKLVSSTANTSEGLFYLVKFSKAFEAQEFFDKQQVKAKEKKAKKEKKSDS